MELNADPRATRRCASIPGTAAFTVLIFVGCFTKSAQFPFHFWLPGAMCAPTPASAYLHSATMVKAGIYLLLRLYPVLGDTPLWQNGLLAIGLITMLMGAVLALRQRDLKAALAYSTISQLGVLVALISLPDGEGLQAALVGILAHSLYKAALFLVVGAVDHAAGTRDLTQAGRAGALDARLGGGRAAGGPVDGGPAAAARLRRQRNAARCHARKRRWRWPSIVVTAALTVAMALILIWDVFWGKRRDHALTCTNSPQGLLVGPAVLAGGSLLAGLGLQLAGRAAG